MVRTMKRGENGSINVSMGSLKADRVVLFSAVLFLVSRIGHDIRLNRHGYDSGRTLRGYRILRRRINPSLGARQRRLRMLFCSATNPRYIHIWNCSVTMRAHLVGNPALLQAIPGQPCIGAVDGALDMVGRGVEIIGRPQQRTYWRHDEIFDVR